MEILKAGREAVAEWMTRLARICTKERRLPVDWQEACAVLIYEGMDERSE